MGFDRYRYVFDRIFPFSKLPEYRHFFRFRKYRTTFISDEKNIKVKMMEFFADRFRSFSSLPNSKTRWRDETQLTEILKMYLWLSLLLSHNEIATHTLTRSRSWEQQSDISPFR